MKIRFLPPAHQELIEAVRYYNAQRIQLGDEFRDEAWATIRRINDFPIAWYSLGGSIRRCQMQRFPYGVIYEPTSVEILIIAVAHLHQESRDWRVRLKSNTTDKPNQR